MKSFLFACLLVSSGVLYAQTTTPEILSTSGGNGGINNVNLNWTIGEPIIQTCTNGATTLNSGFQQGFLSISTLSESIKNDSTQISIFPNPTSDKLVIKSNKLLSLKFELFSFDGKMIATNVITNTESDIDLRTSPKGEYILRLTNDNKLINSYKIIKL